MKLSKIGALCKGAKRFVIVNLGYGQWISDGVGLYPLRDLPHLDEESVYTIFDIPEDKRSKMLYEERESISNGFSLLDATEDEVAVQLSPISIVYHGAVYTPIKSREGILFLDRRYLAPFDEGITLFERFYADSSIPYIAVKRGLLLEGIILPSPIASVELAETLKHIGELMALMCEDEDEAEQEEMDI